MGRDFASDFISGNLIGNIRNFTSDFTWDVSQAGDRPYDKWVLGTSDASLSITQTECTKSSSHPFT